MLKKTITVLMMFVFTGTLVAQQRDLVIEGNHLSVQDSDEPQNGVVYSYLWWFGDGGYKITEEDHTTHLYHDDYTFKTNPDQYITSLITTENYGSEGNPDLIFAPVLFSSLVNTTSDLPKYLDPSDPTDFVRLTSFRNVVPGDTFYLIVTYGFPDMEMYNSVKPSRLKISLIEENGDSPFEYIYDSNWNKSFLPHNEQIIQNKRPTFGYNVIINLPQGPNKLEKGEERTLLVPVKYNGSRTEGSISCKISFNFYDSLNINQGVGIIEVDAKFENLKLAASHDPNSTHVSIDTASCIIGGQELEYEVQFENTGEGQTDYVRIEMQLDEAHDLNSLEIANLPRWFDTIVEGSIHGYQQNYSSTSKDAFYKVDEVNNKVIFEFHNIFLTGLLDTLTNDPNRRKDYISFKLKVKEGYVIGDPITAFASIIFDDNEPVITNVVETTCPNPIPVDTIDDDCNLSFAGLCWYWWIFIGVILFIILFIIVLWIRLKRNQ